MDTLKMQLKANLLTWLKKSNEHITELETDMSLVIYNSSLDDVDEMQIALDIERIELAANEMAELFAVISTLIDFIDRSTVHNDLPL